MIENKKNTDTDTDKIINLRFNAALQQLTAFRHFQEKIVSKTIQCKHEKNIVVLSLRQKFFKQFRLIKLFIDF